MDKNKIKAVIFDWGGVCCQEGEPFASSALQKILSINPEEIADQVRSIYNDYYQGKYDRETFWRAVMAHFQLPVSAEINPAALGDAYLNSYRLYPEVLETTKKLQKNYQVALLSNLTPEMRDYIRLRHEVKKYFNPEVYSCDNDVRAMKPESEPYLITLKKLNRSPEQCLFIDNSMKNIQAAKNLGLQTILFKEVESFLKEIKILL